MSLFYEVKRCPYCGRKIYPVLVPVVFNTTNGEAYEVQYMDCYCQMYKKYNSGGDAIATDNK